MREMWAQWKVEWCVHQQSLILLAVLGGMVLGIICVTVTASPQYLARYLWMHTLFVAYAYALVAGPLMAESALLAGSEEWQRTFPMGQPKMVGSRFLMGLVPLMLHLGLWWALVVTNVPVLTELLMFLESTFDPGTYSVDRIAVSEGTTLTVMGVVWAYVVGFWLTASANRSEAPALLAACGVAGAMWWLVGLELGGGYAMGSLEGQARWESDALSTIAWIVALTLVVSARGLYEVGQREARCEVLRVSNAIRVAGLVGALWIGASVLFSLPYS